MQKIVVSLTSYPKRIEIVDKVIESLLKQRIPADEIILYLSIEEFPDKWNSLPERLLKLTTNGVFKIEWVEGNLKSHKKYFYALQNNKENIVITVDDDVIYSSLLISDFIYGHDKFPNAVLARRARIILKKIMR